MTALLSLVFKKPDVEEEECPDQDNALKPDEEFVVNSGLDLDGMHLFINTV